MDSSTTRPGTACAPLPGPEWGPAATSPDDITPPSPRLLDGQRFIQLALYMGLVVRKMADGDLMKIPLDRSPGGEGRLPLARQIQGHIERLITQGLLAPGVKRPAAREAG